MQDHLPNSDPHLFPEDVAFAPRTDMSQIRMTGLAVSSLDTLSGNLLGLLGHRPAVRHVSGVTEPILELLERAGRPVQEDTRSYRDRAEAEAHADALIAEGYRLAGIYPLPAGRYPEAGLLVPPELWNRLNDKRNLGELVPQENLPGRQFMAVEAARDKGFSAPVWVKLGEAAATGAGFAVRPCTTAAEYAEALDWFAAEMPGAGLVVERDVPVRLTWCATMVVRDDHTQYLGAAEQLFARPGVQIGSRIDDSDPFPAPELVVAAGEAARRQGFRGPAGLDIGQTADGRLVVFDPNFRGNASLPQSLLHRAACQRAGGASVSRSVILYSPLPMAQVIRRLTGPVDARWFVPLRLADAALLPAARGRCLVTGFVLGDSAAAAEHALAEVARLLEAG